MGIIFCWPRCMNRAHDCAEYYHSELYTNGLLMFYRNQVRYAPGSQFVSLHASGIIYVILTWLRCATDGPYSSNVQLTTACCAAFKFHCRPVQGSWGGSAGVYLRGYAPHWQPSERARRGQVVLPGVREGVRRPAPSWCGHNSLVTSAWGWLGAIKIF